MGLEDFLNSHWLRESVMVLHFRFTCGLFWITVHQYRFRRMKKSTWNPTRQVWIMLVVMVGNFSVLLLKVGLTDFAARIRVYGYSFDPPKDFGL